MRIVGIAEFRARRKQSMVRAIPCLLTWDGEPFAVVAKPDEVIVLSDLHPRVRIHLKALEMKARSGMPAPEHGIPVLEPEPPEDTEEIEEVKEEVAVEGS